MNPSKPCLKGTSGIPVMHLSHIVPICALTLLVMGCSQTDNFPGYKKRSGDLGAFIIQHASKFGARMHQTNTLPQFTATWSFMEDAGGFQIYLAGNHFAELQSFLLAAYGPPAVSPKTNEYFDTMHIGAYYGRELGAALQYGYETTRDGKQYTSMVVVSSASLNKSLP